VLGSPRSFGSLYLRLITKMDKQQVRVRVRVSYLIHLEFVHEDCV
jgi:hypothetical protein